MPVTINGTTGITSPGGDTSTSLTTSGLTIGTTPIGAGNATRFKNRIINGDMRIDQRNAGASVTESGAAGQFSLDRWQIFGDVASKFTAQQNAGSITPPAGFSNYLGITSLSAYSVPSAEGYTIQQRIEGFNFSDLSWGTANAKTVTLSFQVYSSLTGTFGGSFTNSAFNRSYPFSYSIPVANTWTSISVTIAGDTTGTWIGATNGIGVRVYFGLGAGSTLSGTAGSWSANGYISATGATSVVGTSGATFYITGVQLEVGSSATGFEYVDYGTQLAMCQRYYAKSYDYATVPATSEAGNSRVATYANDTNAVFYMKLPINMRTAPTLTVYSTYNGASGFAREGGSTTNKAVTTLGTGETACLVALLGTATATNFYYIQYAVSAEL
jgi:hypothetical protein